MKIKLLSIIISMYISFPVHANSETRYDLNNTYNIIKDIYGYYKSETSIKKSYLYIDGNFYIHGTENIFGETVESIGIYTPIGNLDLVYERKSILLFASERNCRYDPTVARSAYKTIIEYMEKGQFSGDVILTTELGLNHPKYDPSKSHAEILESYTLSDKNSTKRASVGVGQFHSVNVDEIPTWFKTIIRNTAKNNSYACP